MLLVMAQQTLYSETACVEFCNKLQQMLDGSDSFRITQQMTVSDHKKSKNESAILFTH